MAFTSPREMYITKDLATPAGPPLPFDGQVDAIYMTRRQKEREKSVPVEVSLPCPHCGQFLIVGVIQNA